MKKRRKKSKPPHGLRPLVEVTLRGKCKRKKRCPSYSGKMLVDTGASHSFIDEKAVKALKLKSQGKSKIHGIAGGKKPIVLDRYPVTMQFPPALGLRDVPLTQHGAYAKKGLHKDGRVGIVGRDAMSGGDDPKARMTVEYDSYTSTLALRPSTAVLNAVREELVRRELNKRK